MILAQGGRTNAYPSRTYPEEPATDAQSFQGGARGPAALPSRITTRVLPAPPGMVGGAWGPEGMGPIPASPGGSRRRAPVSAIPQVPQQRHQFDNTYDHQTIPWSRPVYDNIAGRDGYKPPTQLPSWTANEVPDPCGPKSAVPFDRKRIDSFTQREEYGSTRQFFPVFAIPNTRRPASGMNQNLRRSGAQARTGNPWQPLLTQYGLSGSYGLTTRVLKTAPVNQPSAVASPFGAY